MENREKSSFMKCNLISIFDQKRLQSKTQKFHLIQYNDQNNKLFVKRDDLIHAEVSGNKWRKLKWNMLSARQNKCTLINTYGGAYSNHLLATASLGNELNIKTRGQVRGDELSIDSNPLLRRCADLNMELVFLTRKDYKEVKDFNGLDHSEKYIWNIPEGGSNKEGVKGCAEIMQETENDYDYVVVAQGTTTTSLGVFSSLNKKTKLIVVPVLKGFDSIKEMKSLATYCEMSIDDSRIIVLNQFHFGGYAKTNQTLNLFINEFNKMGGFKIEPTYTGKVLYALNDFMHTNDLVNKKILFIHTGGLSQY